jgi:hypothetical protein
MELTEEQKFEALKLRYADHVELLRFMTKLDVQLFSGYITLQIALGAWIATHPINGIWNDYKRREEVVGIIKNINEALNFNTSGAYLSDSPINVQTETRPWHKWFLIGIATGVLGIIMVTFGGVVIPQIAQ